MSISLTPSILSLRSSAPAMARARRRKIIEGVLDGKTIKEATIDMGMNPSSGYRALARDDSVSLIGESYRQILASVGVTDEYLAKKVFDLTNAQEIKFFAEHGKITDSVQVPALETQRKSVEMAHKLAGHLKDKQELDIKVGIMAMVVDALQAKRE